MRNVAILLSILAVVGCDRMNIASRSGSATWLTEYDSALEQAKAKNRPVLINFTGSDWCGWCKKLQAEVFSRAAFCEYAESNLVLLEIDFPRGKTQLPQVAQANQELAGRFNVQGFPTIFLIDSQGRTLGNTGYQKGGAEAFVALLQEMATRSPKPVEPDAEAGEQMGLRLSGISGAAGNRLAMVNNVTLSQGESAFVDTPEGRLQVQCLEVLDDRVVLAVDGHERPVALALSGRL